MDGFSEVMLGMARDEGDGYGTRERSDVLRGILGLCIGMRMRLTEGSPN